MHVAEFINNKLMYKCIHVQKIKLLAHVIILRTQMFYFWFSQWWLKITVFCDTLNVLIEFCVAKLT